jgi:ribosome biogenesis protein ENP2
LIYNVIIHAGSCLPVLPASPCPLARFVTKADLARLGLDHLVGTPLLRAYMHGFFVDNRLYAKATSLTQPFAYDAYRQQRVAQKLEAERASRISVVKRLPKVGFLAWLSDLVRQVGVQHDQLL